MSSADMCQPKSNRRYSGNQHYSAHSHDTLPGIDFSHVCHAILPALFRQPALLRDPHRDGVFYPFENLDVFHLTLYCCCTYNTDVLEKLLYNNIIPQRVPGMQIRLFCCVWGVPHLRLARKPSLILRERLRKYVHVLTTPPGDVCLFGVSCWAPAFFFLFVFACVVFVDRIYAAAFPPTSLESGGCVI